MTFDGILNLDKPAGLTSARAVAMVKRLIPRGTKVGHAGALDPFATGVLLILLGKATKLCERLMGQPKTYLATIKLGATTPTGDPESPEQITSHIIPPQLPQVESALKQFLGPIQQLPPQYSALKVGGRPAYELARRGEHAPLQPRTVQVYSINFLKYKWPLLNLEIQCGRGTYIRSIAADLGTVLNTDGYLTQLRRTCIGKFDIDHSVKLEQLTADSIQNHLLPLTGDLLK